jgi:hypothetical protein
VCLQRESYINSYSYSSSSSSSSSRLLCKQILYSGEREQYASTSDVLIAFLSSSA